jgi:putative ABC transport system permease protein
VGRLKDGVAKSQAETELDLLVANWSKRTGASGHVFVPDQHVLQIAPALDEVVGSTRRVFWLLQAGVGMVLVLACANLASLLVVRAEVRGREVAVRKALGAGPRRLLAQFVVEGLVLLVLGSALGLAIASAGVHLLAVTYHDSLPRVADMGIDPSVLGFTLLISVITGVVFAVAPLRYLSDRSGGSILSYRAPTQSTRTWMRRGLVAGEVALAVVLVSSAGLMIRTVLNLMSVESGFDRSRLVTFAAALPASSYPLVGQRMQVYDRLIDRLSAMPGIEGVAGVTGLPPRRGRNVFGTDIEGYVVPFCSINCPESFRPLSVAALGRASAMRTSTL